MKAIQSKGNTEPQNTHKGYYIIILASILAERGTEFFKHGDYESAINVFSDAIQLDPYDFKYKNNLNRLIANRAAIYLKLEMGKECILDCDNAIELIQREEQILKDEIKKEDGNSHTRNLMKSKVYVRRGTAHIKCLKDLSKGLKDYESALKYSPDNDSLKTDINSLKIQIEEMK
jgi:tetratricopeptide (TPR) repeat protein